MLAQRQQVNQVSLQAIFRLLLRRRGLTRDVQMLQIRTVIQSRKRPVYLISLLSQRRDMKSMTDDIKHMCKKYSSAFSGGFTLIEMLTAMIIFIVIGSVVVSILTTSFRTAHKTDIVTLVQHNGNYAITQMAKTIRDARGLVSPFPCVPVNPTPVSSITIITSDNQEITYACVTNPSPTPNTIASNGASLLDTTVVALSQCSFACTQQSSSELPYITINFSLTQQTTSTFAEQLASQSAVPFQTSVVIRNINR